MSKEITEYSFIQLHKQEVFHKLSSDIQKFVNKTNGYTAIRGKKYVHVSCWQMVGGLLGLSAIVQSCTNLSTDTETKYSAKVSILNNASGEIVGTGFAVCSNKEKTKGRFEEYAIASMAQTRAIGKAFRATCGWVMQAAGFESTPAEEMTTEKEEKAEPLNWQVIEEYKRVLAYSIENAKYAKDVKNLMTMAEYVSNNPKFIDFANKRYKALREFEENDR